MKRSVKIAVSFILSLFMIAGLLQFSTLNVKADGKVEDIFSDIKGDEWFVPFVQFVYEHGIMTGKGERFDPGGNMQREEITQIIYKMAGQPEIPANTASPFTDVKTTDWFFKGVVWCSQNGIVSGVGNGKFGTGQKITRQDFALMLYKYAVLVQWPTINDIDDNAIEGYADTAKVSSYAKKAMNWAVTNGLISGKGNSGAPKSELRLDPTGYTTRAEGATLITRFANSMFKPQVGDVIKIGKFEQDDNTENGKEDIEWIVLDVQGRRALVISKYGLVNIPYNETETEVTWETCTLRKWLNNDFFNSTFTDAEKKTIPTVTVENKNNPRHNTPGGNDTRDKIFCLSVEEMEKYYGKYNWYNGDEMFGYNQNLIHSPTQYAISSGAGNRYITGEDYEKYLREKDYSTDVIGKTGCWWWLRTPGSDPCNACVVDHFGCAGADMERWVDQTKFTVRPAMYIDF